jgi:hypothetical protein
VTIWRSSLVAYEQLRNQKTVIIWSYPHLKPKSRLSVRTNDRSSASSWTGHLTTDNIHFKTTWRLGYEQAKSFLIKNGFTTEEFDLNDEITILKPFGVSLNSELSLLDHLKSTQSNASSSIPMNEEIDRFGELENDQLQNFEDYIDEPIHHINKQIIPYVEVDGKRVHKANLVNSELNNQTKISTDRIFRVRNKNNEPIWINKDVDDDDENQIHVTDKILTLVKIKDKAPVLVVLIIDKIKQNDVSITSIRPSLIQEFQLRGSILK